MPRARSQDEIRIRIVREHRLVINRLNKAVTRSAVCAGLRRTPRHFVEVRSLAAYTRCKCGRLLKHESRESGQFRRCWRCGHRVKLESPPAGGAVSFQVENWYPAPSQHEAYLNLNLSPPSNIPPNVKETVSKARDDANLQEFSPLEEEFVKECVFSQMAFADKINRLHTPGAGQSISRIEIEKLINVRPSIRVKVTPSPKIQAVVVATGSNDYEISMSNQIFIVLNTIFSRVLANPKFMSWIGHAPSQGTFLKNLFGMRLAWPWLGSDAKPKISASTVMVAIEPPEERGSQTLPFDLTDCFWGEDFLDRQKTRDSRPEREEAADWLAWLAVRFLIAHEVRHVLAGHSRYWKSRFGYKELSESPAPKPRTSHENGKLRALEADADVAAMQTLIIHLSRIQLGFDKMDVNGRRYLRDPWHVLLVAILCSHAVCYVLDPPWTSLATAPYAKHPSYSIRRMLTLNQATAFIPFLGYKKTRDVEITDVIALQVERNLGSVFGEEKSRLFQTLGMLDAVKQEVAELEKDRKAMFTDLRRLSYVKLS
jgi:hypothetical protein